MLKTSLLLSIIGTVSVVTAQQQIPMFELYPTMSESFLNERESIQPQELDILESTCVYEVNGSFYEMTKLRDDK